VSGVWQGLLETGLLYQAAHPASMAERVGDMHLGSSLQKRRHGAHFHFITVPNATVVLNIGLISVGATLILSLLTQATAATTSIGPVPITLALIALIVGIPHGAVDNLTLTRGLTTRQRLIGVTAYVSIAGAAALCIVQWPGMAFLAVLGMTVWHFGTGDVEATRELQNLAPLSGLPRVAYALALGSAPVLLPLTSPAAVSTLTAIEPRLATLMNETAIIGIRITVLILVVLCLLWLIARGDLRGVIELFALAALGLLVTPLVAFATYFGFWHALRHTARLAQVTYGTISWRSMVLVSRGGAPSLIGFVLILVITISFVDPVLTAERALWLGLAIVWGLTVPHMFMVARFDARMRSERSPVGNTQLRDRQQSFDLQEQ